MVRLKHIFLMCVLLCFLKGSVTAQKKVGLVLSGGGASGIAHIGVLKALEENNIPIDYITGSSMGALIGGLYAAGYSVKQIEGFFTSERFSLWAEGQIGEKYEPYYRKKEITASWITVKFSPDMNFNTSLPTNLQSPDALNIGLLEFFSPASAVARDNFDSLMIPFRCVASDIYNKRLVLFKEGSLNTAIRASMTYPFVMKPISVDGNLLFDGGLYNNFPSDIMYDEFLPDYIIGSNVSYNYPPPTENDLISQLKVMLVSNTNYNISCGEDGIVLEPPTSDYSAFDFQNVEDIIDSGYYYTLRYIDQIKKDVHNEVQPNYLQAKRAQFNAKKKPLIFKSISIDGISNNQKKYVIKSLKINRKQDSISLTELVPRYFDLSSDDQIRDIHPKTSYDQSINGYNLNLDIDKEKDLFVEFGGNISSRPINEGFIGLRYNHLGKSATTIYGNTYFGKLYSSVLTGIRMDFPSRLPFYIETKMVLNKWDYFKSSSTFFEDVKPSYLIIKDSYLQGNFGFPIDKKGKLELGGTLARLQNEYYQTKAFSSIDTADITDFEHYSIYGFYERNSLDKKQYATSGSHLKLKARFVSGFEHTTPGSTGLSGLETEATHKWIQAKFSYEKYFNRKGKYRFGIYGEAVTSGQPFFQNYTATILSAPAFQPIPESKTLFQSRFRAFDYGSIGLINILALNNNLQLRAEAYLFQPLNEIKANQSLGANLGYELEEQFVVGSFAVVYDSPLGPIALNLNFYDKQEQHFSFLFHFGYMIFNEKALD